MAIYSLFSPAGQATKALDIETDAQKLTESSDTTWPTPINNFFLNGGLMFYKEGNLVTLIPGSQDSRGQLDVTSIGSAVRILTTNMSYIIGAPPQGFYNPDQPIDTFFLALYIDSNGIIRGVNNIAFYQNNSGSLTMAPVYIDVSGYLSELSKVIFIPIKNSYII